MHRPRAVIATALAFLTITAPLSLAQNPLPVIEPKADAVLKQMCETLAAAKEFSVETTTLIDEISPTGQKLQYGKNSKVLVRRPDRLHSVVSGDRENYTVVYDGKTIAFLDPAQNVYATATLPPTIDAAMDTLAQKYGIVAPLADLIFSKPYEALSDRVKAGIYVGEHAVNKVPCHHLAFRGEAVDWQIWIDKGAKPLPRKLVISYKMLPGEPQFIAIIDNWNLDPKLGEDAFKFTPPAGSRQIELKPVVPSPQPAGQ